MRMIGIRRAVLALACLAAGCSSSGIESGIPKDLSPAQGGNPTPDMGAPPAPAKK